MRKSQFSNVEPQQLANPAASRGVSELLRLKALIQLAISAYLNKEAPAWLQ